MTREQIQQSFAAHLRSKLREYYGDRLPSAATFAMHFNLRCQNDQAGISDETARRWLRGSSMPDAVCKQVLVTWLKLNLHEALGCPDQTVEHSSKDRLAKEFLCLLPRLNPDKQQAFLHLLRLSVEPR